MNTIALWFGAIALSVAFGAIAAHYDMEFDLQDAQPTDSPPLPCVHCLMHTAETTSRKDLE